MEPIACAFTVSYRYEVHFTRAAFALDNETFRNVLQASGARRLLVLAEERVVAANPRLPADLENYLVKTALPWSAKVLPGGETAKESDTVAKEIYRLMETAQICRHSCIAAIGGGAFLDVAGYAAATFHRGIKHLRFPSTLLGQADAGVGVKNAINFAGKKNLLGTFAPPLAVINDLDLLDSLDPEEMRAGLSEAVKVAMIRDAAFFEWIEAKAHRLRAGKPVDIEILARQCAGLHVRHISGGGDPFEWGSRRPLDFGHWAAHKMEQMSGFRLRHGEAVAVGIALDSVYACKINRFAPAHLERALRLLEKLGLPIFCEELLDSAELVKGLSEFREHLGGALCITLPSRIGESFDVHTMDETVILESIQFLKERAGKKDQA